MQRTPLTCKTPMRRSGIKSKTPVAGTGALRVDAAQRMNAAYSAKLRALKGRS